MYRLPSMVFIADVRREHIAVKEANKLDIPIIAMVDTNCDPTPIDLVIPSNDDAIKSNKLISHKLSEAVIEGQQIREALLAEEEEEALEAREEWGEPVAVEEVPIGADEFAVGQEVGSEVEGAAVVTESVSEEEMPSEVDRHSDEDEGDAFEDSHDAYGAIPEEDTNGG